METAPFFSIIIVSLNPGGRLRRTLDSIKAQTFTDYEVIVKDGGSEDGSTDFLLLGDGPEGRDVAGGVSRSTGTNVANRTSQETDISDESPIRLIVKKDRGIYDAMNEAVGYATGRYVYFLNCGDLLAGSTVLAEVAERLREVEDGSASANNSTQKEEKDTDNNENADENAAPPYILYGDIYDLQTKKPVASNPRIDSFACYRNVPCHQACFYARSLVTAHPFRPEYRVRADYEQFLWCYFKGEAGFLYLNRIVVQYEGGGYSAQNEARSAAEHREITADYFSRSQRFRYRAILALTLAPLRTALSQNRATAGFYNGLKSLLYRFRD